MRRKRVISLLPAATEIVCALGAADQLVGRSHECDYPPAVLGLPVCTACKLDVNAPGAEIDRQAGALVQQAVSLYELDVKKLRHLQPDIILTQAQCAVCAVSLAEVEQAVSQWLGSHPQIVSLSPTRMVNIWEDMLRVAEVLSLAEIGREVVRPLKLRVVGVIERACLVKHKPAVACIEWIEPLMAAGNWLPELVELAGGENLFGEAGQHSPPLSWEALRDSDPEVIILMPCGFNLARTRAEMAPLASRPGWSKLRAVKAHRVYLTDGSQFFNRPGPRIVESLEMMAEMLHSDRFNYGHRGKGWEKL